MSDTAFSEFRAAVLADTDLQDKLREINDRAEFISSVVDLASKLGINLSAEDVENAMNTGRREWIERWI